jgi:hypothetical protein
VLPCSVLVHLQVLLGLAVQLAAVPAVLVWQGSMWCWARRTQRAQVVLCLAVPDVTWSRAVPDQQHAVRAFVQFLAVPGCRMVAGSAGPAACCACSCAMPGGARMPYGRGQCRTSSMLCVQLCNGWRCQGAVWSRAVPDPCAVHREHCLC